MAIGGYIAVVFVQIARETMMAISVADEIEKLGSCGMHRRGQRVLSGITDWPRWQAWETISVIGRIYGEVDVMKAAGIISGQQERVNHAWVGIERGPMRQAIV